MVSGPCRISSLSAGKNSTLAAQWTAVRPDGGRERREGGRRVCRKINRKRRRGYWMEE